MDDTFFSGDLPDATRLLEAYRKALFEVNETVSELGRRQDKLQSTLNQFNSGSETAEKIATKLVAVNARLNDELREQADLLRRVAGINVTELEASKGRKSIETKGKREQFLARQAQEAEAVQKSLLKLAEAQAKVDNARLDARAEQAQIRQEQQIRAANDETIRSLERRLAIEEKIANVRSARVAREASSRAQFLAGNPNQYGAGAVGPQSGRIDALQAANRLAQQRLSIRKEIQKSAAGTRFELVKQLAVLKQVATIGETINKSTEQELKNQRRINREIKVRKGREAKKQFNQRAESIALGVGFPLLFGGGAGSVGGSFAGSFVGSGFGGQIAGGAIGQAIDNYVQGLTKLANSLESTTGIIQGLEEAGYKVSAATESVIASYQKAGLEAEAYEIAISEINRVLGPDGASKLSDYRLANKELQGAFEEAKAALDSELLPALTGMIRLILGLKSAFDTLANNPIFKAVFKSDLPPVAQRLINKSLGEPVKNLPGAGGLVRGVEFFQEIGAPSGDVVKPEGQRLAEEDAKLKKLTAQNEELAKQQQKQWEIDDTTRRTNETLEKQIAIERAGTDIKDDNVYKKHQEAIEQVYLNAMIDAGTNAEARRNAELNRTLSLLKLYNQRNKAFTSAGRSAPKSKALQLQQQLIKEELKRTEIGIKYLQIIQGEEAALKAKQSLLVERLAKETKVLELQRQQALENNKVAGDAALINQVYDSRINTLTQQLQLQQQQNAERLRALALEKQLQDISNQQELAGISTDLNRQIEDAQFRTNNPFGGFDAEQAELAIQQTRRYKDAIGDITDALEKQEAIVNANVNADAVAAAIKEIKQLERKKQLYEDLLPALNAAEQAELKMTQTLQALQPITDGLAAGISEVFASLVDGSKSAEQAVSDMFKNIGKAFLDMAAEMIAQYLIMKAIGLISSFFGGGGAQNNPLNPVIPNVNNLPKRETGGQVSATRPYMVGERGPELFVPSQNGRVMSNNDTRQALGRYQSNAATTPRTIRFESQVINNVEYVTRDEAVAIGRQAADDGAQRGAKMGTAQTMSGLRNSRSQRSKIGLR